MSTRYLQNFSSPTEIQAGLGHTGVGVVGGRAYVNYAGGARSLAVDDALQAPYFVNANSGVDTNSGRSWSDPFLTMAKALSVVASGGSIHFVGKIREQLVAPSLVFDVAIVGHGNRPRHADASPVGSSLAAATWTTPASGATTAALLRVQQQGWAFINILFAGPADQACVELNRTAEGVDERDASHATFIGCRFASGLDGISDIGGCFGVGIYDCRFGAVTGFAIKGVGNIGVGQSDWILENCHFNGIVNGVKIAGFGCRIKGNTFTDGGTPNTTVVLNTNNGGGSDNFIVDNAFQTATANFNTPDVVGTATDVWNGNMTPDAAAAGVSGIFEIGRPA